MHIPHIKTIYILLVIPILILGCDSPSQNTKESSRQFSDDGILKFNSKQVSKGDVIVITLPQPHPKELAIKSPNGQWFYLQVENEGDSNKLMSSSKFASLTILKLNTLTLKALYWSNGKAKKETVFTATGKYLIYMADNLETEPENTLSFSSIIHYTN